MAKYAQPVFVSQWKVTQTLPCLAFVATIMAGPSTALCTSIAIEASGTAVAISADSGVTRKSFSHTSECKIRRCGDTLISIAGWETSRDWDAYKIACKSLRPNLPLHETADNFQTTIIPLIERHIEKHPGVPALTPEQLGQPVRLAGRDILFATFATVENHSPIVAIRELYISDKESAKIRIAVDSVDWPDGHPMNGIFAYPIGETSFAKAIRQRPDFVSLSLIDGSRAMVQAEIDNVKDGTVAAPIATVSIDSKGIRFDQLGACGK
jgi:hypothetical protein